MDVIEAEVTEKIRNAIKRKLQNLDAFLDDELPEYIMVMIANKKSKSQMISDLSLFLGSNTVEFTNWLHNLLINIRSSSLDVSNSVDDDVKMKKSSLEDDLKKYTEGKTDNVNKDSDEDVLALEAHEQDDDALTQELELENTVHSSTAVTEPKVKQKKELSHVGKSVQVTVEEPVKKQSKPKEIKTIPLKRKKSKSIVIPLKRKYRTPSPDKVADEYDPLHPSVGSVASIVRMTDRKSSVPPSLQANKLLLLRAVDDANKSVMSSNRLDDSYKPTPIKDLANNCRNKNLVDCSSHCNKKLDEYTSFTFNDLSNTQNDSLDDEVNHNIINLNAFSDEEHLLRTYQKKISPKIDKSKNSSVFIDDNDSGDNVISNILIDKTNSDSQPFSHTPHFVVTLDGIDANFFKRKKNLETSMDVSDNLHQNINNMVAENEETEVKKLKLVEKCRYWPQCKNGAQCMFYHPSTTCKTFPNCKFGDKCLYIHPTCKFDALCSKKDCSFTHVNKRNFTYLPSTPSSNYYYSPTKPVCKFFPNCSSSNCQFFHPKKCRYGAECQIKKCMYVHSTVPLRHQLKWKAH